MQMEQGDILRIEGIAHPVMIVSNAFFNRSGSAIVCPIVEKTAEGPLHIRLEGNQNIRGIVLCEQMKYLDLRNRRYAKLGSASYYETMDISDAVMGIFDYQNT